MKTLNYIVTITLALLFSCSNSSSYEDKQEIKEEVKKELTEEELKEQLKEKECTNPSDYIDGKLGYEKIYKNALSLKYKGIKYHCTLNNTATMATYKNVKCKIEFLSKTGAVVLEKEFTVFDYIKPNSSYKYNNEISMSNADAQSIVDMKWYINDAECN